MGTISATNQPNTNGGTLNDNLQCGRAIIILSQVWKRPRYQTNRHVNVDLEPIPVTVVQCILKSIQEKAKDGLLEFQIVAGAHKVAGVADAGKVLDLPSIMISFEPCSPVPQIRGLASNIATIANQESVLLCLDHTVPDDANEAATVAEIMLSPSRDMMFDGELLRQIAEKYGGATRIGDHRIFVAVDFDKSSSFQGTVQDAASYFYGLIGAANLNFGCMNASFPRGRKAVTIAQNFAAMTARLEDLDNEIKRRLTITFAATWELLLLYEFRPPYRDYLIIDQKIFTSKKKVAPMHWSVRAVKLDENRAEIEGFWSSELVLNNRIDGKLEADPLIGRAKASPGMLLIKDVNWESTAIRTLGSYVIPVEDAGVAITAMKNMSATAGTEKQEAEEEK